MKFGKVLFGVGLGVLAGLLFAPKKGSELREDIKAKSKSTYDYLASLTREDVEAKLGETIENIKKSDRKSTRLNSSHVSESRMPSSA